MALSRKGDCKMKKFLALTCAIACLFGMTACGSEKTLTDYEQYKVNSVINITETKLIPIMQVLANSEETIEVLNEYTADEVESVVSQAYSLNVEGHAFISAIDSFQSTYEEIGGFGEITDTSAVIDGDQIIVTVEVKGPEKDAQAEVVYSNDFFYRMESASLNSVSTFGDSMAKAGLNTVLGMGTVFAILILISLIISAFSLISKAQNAMKKKEEASKTSGIDHAVAHITEQEESAAEDDLELVAVIAAAIAASEGAATTDGFVVRSIKRR